MTELEDLMKAAMAAPVAKREEALRLLKGQLPKPEPYLTLTDLGRRLGFSTRTLCRWQIPSHDLGASKRYRLSEVEAYLKSEAFLRRQGALCAERRISAKAAGWRLKPQTPTRKENHALLPRPNHHLHPSSLSSRV